jgi:large repetitive protein
MKTKSILQNAIFASITVALIFSFTVSKINNVNVLDFFDGVLKTEASTGNISPSFLCSTGTYRQTPSVYTAADLTFTTPLDTPVIFTGSTFANALSPSLTADESPTSLCIQSLPNFGQLYQDNLLINPNPVISPYGFNMSYDIYPNFTKYVPPEGFKGLACFSYYTRYASPQILLVNGNNPLDTNVSQIRISVGGSTRTTCGADGPASTSGTINGKVYNDINQNGFQDINEQDYNITNNLLPAGTNIKITKVDNPAISYTVSPNADGTYSKYLPASQYTILVNIASGYTVTQSTELGDTGNSGANPTTVTVPASDGAISAGKDGIYKLNLPGTITGKIYPEIRIDGIQDAFESDYNSTFNSVPNNTTVTITDITNPSNTFTITPNPNGTYSQPVTPGQYTVTVNPNPNYRVSNSTDIGDPTNSGSNPTTVTITSGQTKSVGNDGIYKKHEITGSLYPDLNNSGVQDNGETYSLSNPLPTGTQVKIECLYPALTTFTYFPVPDNNGNYIQQVEDFNISGTTCKTTITPPTSYLISNSTELGNNGAGSNPTVVAMPAGAIAVSQGKDGLYQVPLPSTITGKIYPDLNGNGIQDTNEPDYSASNPYPTGTRVSFVADLNLIDACAVYPNVDGSYTSCNLSEYLANYWKVIIRPVENYAITNSNDNGTGTGSNPTVINLPRGASVSAGKDGIFKIPKNSGIIFWDKNNNGFQDIDENGIPGVTVTSTNTLFPNNQTFNVTGDSGYYHFDYPENNTTITVTMPTGFTSNTLELPQNHSPLKS